MILYFANRKMKIIGHATTHLPEGFIVVDDDKIEDVDSGVATFSCRIGYTDETRLELESMVEAGNFLLRSNGKKNEFYTIIDSETDTKTKEVYIYAEDAGLDLLNEIVGPFEATESHNVEWYVNKYISNSGFEIGINEIPSTTTRTLVWEGEATVTERLASIATQFGGFEVSYTFEVNGLEVTKKCINIYKERGKNIEEQLRLNREIDRIIIKKSVANLATALRCTGGIPEGKNDPITLKGYNYDDGDFYVDGLLLKSRKAVEKWGRIITTNKTSHIERPYSYQTLSQKTLCSHAVTELKKICEMEVNYEIDINELPENIAIGDRINIVDDAGELYLSARILVLESSVTKDSHKATLGEYKIKNSGISEKVEELAKQYSELSKKRTLYTWTAYADDANGGGISLNSTNKSYLGTAVNRTTEEVDISDPSVFSWVKVYGEDSAVLRIDSSRGTVFKNNQVSTVLSVVVYKGSKRITDISELKKEFGSSAYIEWCWQKMDEETFGTILSTDSRIGNEGFTLSLTPADVNTKAVFMCQLITD